MRESDQVQQDPDEDSTPHPPNKALLRELEFLQQRGLGGESGRLPPVLVPRLRAETRSVDEAAKLLSPYVVGNDQKESLRAASPPDQGIEWRSVGPNGIPNGQTYGSGTTMVSGRVAAVAVDPTDSAHLLIGAAAGGVWETRDTGQTWKPRTDTMPTLSIGALAFDPTEPRIVYAGTGEGNSGYRRLGQGIFKSQDGGSTWEHIASQEFVGHGFYRIVVDPRDGRHLIAATSNGAFVSDDSGVSWRLLHRRRTWDVSLAYQDDEQELLLATQQGLFRLNRDGLGLVQLPRLIRNISGLMDLSAERLAVTHVPTDPGQAFAFAGVRGRPLLWHRADVGKPFLPVSLPSFPISLLDDVLDVKQARYDWFVAVPPDTPNMIYLGAIELVKGERNGGGWRWSDISSRAAAGGSIHPDQHALAFDERQPGVIYAVNDGGIFRSPDAGASWQSLNAGLEISEVEYLAQKYDDPEWILAGLQDNGTIRRTDGKWAQVAKGDGGDCASNVEHPNVCYHTHYRISLYRSETAGDPDPEASELPRNWKRVTPPNSGPDRLKQLFYPPLEVNGNVVVIAGEVVCISDDEGATWTQVPLPPVDGQPSVASALAVPTNRVLVGTVNGDIFEINRGGWSGVPTLLTRPQAGNVSDLLVDLRSEPHRYWATYSTIPGSVFCSNDGGASWADVSNDLPTTPVNAIAVDPSNADRIWVACDLGVYESQDAGEHWSLFGVKLPNALAVDLLFHESSRRLRVATRSRGIWEVVVPAT
jgi:photosystem II stability/assembly factor-like uncharacterized protein